MNDFANDNEFSKSELADSFWNNFYRVAFPDYIRMSETVKDRAMQLHGIDRKIYLKDGIVVLTDEKLRRITYPDFFLEYQSSDVNHSLGWLNKDLDIDYVAYGWYPARFGYLLEWQSLTSAWIRHGHNWIAEYGRKPAYNVGYTTWGVCVPTRVIREVVDCRFVSFFSVLIDNEIEENLEVQLSMF